MRGTAKHKQAKALVADLREHFPPLLPVRVYYRDMQSRGFLGSTTIMMTWDGKPKHFLISIDKSISWEFMRHIIMHEWAHALAWATGPSAFDHGPEWGIAMSRIYQEVVEL
jgi:hypothetical protein